MSTWNTKLENHLTSSFAILDVTLILETIKFIIASRIYSVVFSFNFIRKLSLIFTNTLETVNSFLSHSLRAFQIARNFILISENASSSESNVTKQ